MDCREQWQSLRDATIEADGGGYEQLLRSLLAAPGSEIPFASLRSLDMETVLGTVRRVVKEGIHGVALMPQLELAMLIALKHVAAGRKVVVVAATPAAPGLCRSLMRFLSSTFGISVSTSGVIFGNPTMRLRTVLGSDIILTDIIQLFEEVHRDPDVLCEGQHAILFCEADLCLYDARIGLFERGKLQAVAAIYRATGKPEPWAGKDNTVDLRDVLPRFCSITGLLSYSTPRVLRELRRTYDGIVPSPIRGTTGGVFTAFSFRTFEEKVTTLCRDIMRGAGDVLVFHNNERLQQAVSVELRKRGQDCIAVGSPRDLRAYLTGGGERKRVATYRGVPTLMTVPLDRPSPMRVFVGDHYVFAHQHQKLRAFIERDLQLTGSAAMYFCLEDDMFSVYAEDGAFEHMFRIIDFTERYDKWRQVRRVMGQAILRKIYSLRRSCLDEDFPIFTLVGNTGSALSRQKPKSKRALGKRLEGTCFCGSGKLFAECHGKPKS